ncbi:MAG: bacitracin ABC transporter ATP-binding protein [Subdoligranulum variabile]|nr:MAG: bacitracin ABC transporter ATP-binding protein [Subdoligranulum variabile]
MEYILQTNQVTKIIGGKKLVSGIDLHVKKGEIYGFLGPNGAGKTTMMKMITNLWKPTAGNIEVFGEVLTPKSYAVLKRMGSIIEFPTFYEHMTGRENLQLHCKYMGYAKPENIENTLQLLGMAQAADKPVRSYSLGMKERLGIARAILCEPELLILDEPTNGLDPAGIKQIRELLKKLCTEHGITVMVSSHILSEIESIADTVGIIHHGQMMKEISMRDMEAANQNYIEVAVDDVQKARTVLKEKMGFSHFQAVEDHTFRIYERSATPQAVAKALVLHDVGIISIGKHMETLEDYFLKLTGEASDDVRAD